MTSLLCVCRREIFGGRTLGQLRAGDVRLSNVLEYVRSAHRAPSLHLTADPRNVVQPWPLAQTAPLRSSSPTITIIRVRQTRARLGDSRCRVRWYLGVTWTCPFRRRCEVSQWHCAHLLSLGWSVTTTEWEICHKAGQLTRWCVRHRPWMIP